MKRILLILFSLLVWCSACLAAGTKVGVIVDLPAALKTDDTVLRAVDAETKKIFRNYKFEINPDIKDVLVVVRQYRLDNGLIMANGNGTFLKTQDVQKIGKLLGSDYVFHIEAYPQSMRGKASVFSARVKYIAICNLKVMNVRTGEFVIVKQFDEEGDSGTSMGKMIKHFAEFVPRSIANSKLDVSEL